MLARIRNHHRQPPTSCARVLASVLALGTWMACGGGVSRDPLGQRPAIGGDAGAATPSGGAGSPAEVLGGQRSDELSTGGSLSNAGKSALSPGGQASSGGSPLEHGGAAGAAGTTVDDRGGAGGSIHSEGGEHSNAGTSDLAGGGGAAGGAGDRPARCSPDSPFGTVRRVRGIPDGGVRLRLSPDERTGYYARRFSSSYFDILVTERTSLTEAFGPGESVAFNDSGWDFSPTLPANGSILYLESPREAGRWKIYQSIWDAEHERFGPIELAPGLNYEDSSYEDGSPYVTPNGDAIYFHTNRSGRSTLARAELVGTTFGEPELLDFAVLGQQGSPVVSSDELTLYFAVHNGPSTELSQLDIWMATRPSKDSPFGTLREVEGINTSANEMPSFMSEDGCRLYFDRNTAAPFGWAGPNENAYVAEREPG